MRSVCLFSFVIIYVGYKYIQYISWSTANGISLLCLFFKLNWNSFLKILLKRYSESFCLYSESFCLKECKSTKWCGVLGIVQGNTLALSGSFCDIYRMKRKGWRFPVVNKETLKMFQQEVVLLSGEVGWFSFFVFKYPYVQQSLLWIVGLQVTCNLFCILFWYFIMNISFLYGKKKSISIFKKINPIEERK